MTFEEVIKTIEKDSENHGEFDVAEWLPLAKEGDNKAQFKLGQLYDWGHKVEKNPIIAYMWFDISAICGNKGGAEVRDIIAKTILPMQKELAQSFAQEWIKKYPPNPNP